MKQTVKRYCTRCIARLKQANLRIDRRAKLTLIPVLVVVLLSVPLWSAAVRWRAGAAAPSDSLRVPILVYHNIEPPHVGQSAGQRLLTVDTAVFRRQMSYLATNRYVVVPLEALVEALEGHGSLPPRAVVITFDDGWLTQSQNALPILQQMHFTATFFVITKQIGVGTKYMGPADLAAVQRAGMTIAAHSRTHPNLTKLTDAQLRDEVTGSREDLRKMFGVDAVLFAYPYGAWNGRVAAAVQEAGYHAARAYPGGTWNDAAHRFTLRSVVATDDMTAFEREVGGPVIVARAAVPPAAASGQR